MKKLCILWAVLAMMLPMVVACSDDDEPTPEPTKTALADKDGYIFLDNGEYVAATTNFTTDEVLAALQSKIWCLDIWHCYTTYNIYKFDMNFTQYYKFSTSDDEYVYQAYSLYNVDKIEAATKQRFTLSGKTLNLYNSTADNIVFSYTVVAVDENRIVMDRAFDQTLDFNISQVASLSDSDKKIAKVRCVYVPATE